MFGGTGRSQLSILFSDAYETFVHMNGPFEICHLLLFKTKCKLKSLRMRAWIVNYLTLYEKLYCKGGINHILRDA